MKGTAILFQENEVTFIENIDHTVYEELKAQCGNEQCNCKLDNKIVEFGPISPIFWHEEDVDWDYGY
ncbi:hypothetical protein J2Z40_000491 [Cytobacillus eiseniae]|uniref:Uncharacterized protein n=1 Tax=Cytobacillus eiseniae TaxID=762947 RepID=A0ABS4RAL7_9BACI|nr:hypothetical protein [Cytobacillus eiseniae]MBP2239938.1 hypothetical protein [Cytobacillus eiseniae]